MIIRCRVLLNYIVGAIMLLFTCVLFSTYSAAIDGAKEESLSGTLQNGIRVIDITAYKYGFFPNPIVVKLGERIKLSITAKDVTHGIRVPEFEINRVLPKGETIIVEFTVTRQGEFMVHCSVYCGPNHGKQKTRLIVQ